MKAGLLGILLTACAPDAFVVIGPDTRDGSGVESAADSAALSDSADSSAPSSDSATSPDAAADSTPDAPPPSCDPGDVTYGGKCFYLDGTGGACTSGYSLSSEAALGAVLSGNANAFQGKNYRTTVSANCCVYTSGSPRNFGMVSHCNVAGPFGAGEPKYGGNNCLNIAVAVKPNQITLCERPL
jgi:hypothetical protein